MTAFTEVDHPRQRDGKFAIKPVDEQAAGTRALAATPPVPEPLAFTSERLDLLNQAGVEWDRELDRVKALLAAKSIRGRYPDAAVLVTCDEDTCTRQHFDKLLDGDGGTLLSASDYGALDEHEAEWLIDDLNDMRLGASDALILDGDDERGYSGRLDIAAALAAEQSAVGRPARGQLLLSGYHAAFDELDAGTDTVARNAIGDMLAALRAQGVDTTRLLDQISAEHEEHDR